jgi:hypothetical protein
MIRLFAALLIQDLEHIGRIVGEGAEEATLSQVGRFLRDDTFIDKSSLDAFRALAQNDRERLMSELIWRVTCHLDGSITQLSNIHLFSLGKQFSVVQSASDGRDIFCLRWEGPLLPYS